MPEGLKYELNIPAGTANVPVVARVGTMPPFVTPPEVVTWGTRVFTLGRAADGSPLVTGGHLQYREAFAYSADAEIPGEVPVAPQPEGDRSALHLPPPSPEEAARVAERRPFRPEDDPVQRGALPGSIPRGAQCDTGARPSPAERFAQRKGRAPVGVVDPLGMDNIDRENIALAQFPELAALGEKKGGGAA